MNIVKRSKTASALILAFLLSLSSFAGIPFAAAAANDAPIIAAKPDGTVQLNGTDAAAYAPSVQFAADFTVELWAKSDTPVWNDSGFLLSARAENGVVLSPVKGTTDVDVYVYNGSGRLAKFGASFHVDDIMEWHHYAFAFDFGRPGALYLDGNLVATAPSTGESRHGVSYSALWVGKDPGSPSHYGQAEFDEVRIWNYARSASDIAKYKDVRLSGSESGLVHHWDFDPLDPATVTGAVYSATREAPPLLSFYEDKGKHPLPSLEVMDADFVPFSPYTLHLTVNHGILRLDSTDNLTPMGGENGSSEMSWSGTLEDLNAALETLSYEPNADYYGTDALTVEVTDAGSADDPAPAAGFYQWPITVTGINDAPSFTKGADIEVNEGSGPQTFPAWATGITAGAGETQGVSFTASNDNPELFLEQPTIDGNGTLTFEPKSDITGSANVTVVLKDDGGQALDGADTATDAFKITVGERNTRPFIGSNHALRLNGTDTSITVSGLSNHDAFTAELWARSLTPTWSEDGFLLSSRGPNGFVLHPNKGKKTLSVYYYNSSEIVEMAIEDAFQPADITNWHQYAITYAYEDWDTQYISYSLYMDGKQIANHLFWPGLKTSHTTKPIALSIGRDSSLSRFGQAEVDEVRYWNKQLTPKEIADYYNRKRTGTEANLQLYLNMENITGTTVTDRAGGNNNGTITGSYEAALRPPMGDDPLPEEQILEEDGFVAVPLDEIGDSDEGDAALTADLSAPHGSVRLSGTGGLTLAGGENGTGHVAYTGSPQDLNAALRNLTYEPNGDFNGADAVTLTVIDSGNGAQEDAKSVSRAYPLAVKPVNDAPSFTKGANQQVAIDAPEQIVSRWATDISAGPADEAAQVVTFTVSSDHPELFEEQPSIDTDGNLHYAPAPGVTGQAVVSVALQDDGGTDNGGKDTSAVQTFTIAIVPKLPALSLGSSVLTESSANDGSIAGSLTVTLENGTFAADMDGGVTVNNLPAGLGIRVKRDSDSQLTIAFTGRANSHADANDIENASVTVDPTYISGATVPVTSVPFAFDFADPAPEPLPDPSPDPSPEPSPEPSPGPSPDPIPEPSPSPDPSPEPSSGPAPDPIPSPEPSTTESSSTDPTPDDEEDPTSGSFNVFVGQRSEWSLGSLMTITVPAGAVESDGTIGVAVVPEAQAPAFPDHAALSRVLELASTTGRTFRTPIGMTFRFGDRQVPEGDVPAVFYYNDSLKRWIYEGGSVHPDGTVTVQVDHFTKFAVFGARHTAFADLRGHWAQTYAERLIGMDVLSGFPDGEFHPDTAVTRAQFARMLSRTLGLAVSSSKPADYLDQDGIPAWARTDVTAVTQAGLMRGDALANGRLSRFDANRPITRAEMAVIAANALRAYSMEASGGSTEFRDEDALPSWARNSVHSAAAAGLMSGDPDGAFHPERPATRAEAAALLYRLLDELRES
ncbi:LamG-like jellyroll fold domain-containing protein [Cohnella caldifontis]|uniref:LamG-like jellyroll fold domain-containing protein n=1 Tax=Cohnella caldifontis TaxID=3027471 RepID=UPI0023EC3B9D|nr:LamG-like jellyroll fold domain-containing protein [Cohnella sp. YIM B05605]